MAQHSFWLSHVFNAHRLATLWDSNLVGWIFFGCFARLDSHDSQGASIDAKRILFPGDVVKHHQFQNVPDGFPHIFLNSSYDFPIFPLKTSRTSSTLSPFVGIFQPCRASQALGEFQGAGDDGGRPTAGVLRPHGD